MGPGRDRTRDPWVCSQTRICSRTRYRLRYAARIKKTKTHTTVTSINIKLKQQLVTKTENGPSPILL